MMEVVDQSYAGSDPNRSEILADAYNFFQNFKRSL